MRLYNRILIALALTGLILLSGCGDGSEEPSAKETQLKNLSGTWELTGASVSGDDVSTDYASFALTLSGSATAEIFTYATSGRPDLSPWPANGTWSFGSDLNSTIIRDPGADDELQMDYALAGTQLTVSFSYTGSGYNARVNSMEGDWTYTFKKK